MTFRTRVFPMVLALALAARGFAGGPGAALFARNCTLCHGADRKGSPRMAKSLGAAALDLTDAASRARTPDEMATTIREGKGRMPGWGTRLDDGEIADLVGFLRSQGPTGATTSAAASRPSTGPASSAASPATSSPATVTR